MPPKRPLSALVFAILNIVFGSLSAIGLLFSGLMLAFGFGMLSSAASTQKVPSTTPIPLFPSDAAAVQITEFAIQFILSIVLIFGGIGLLGMNPWARKLCIAVSIIGILLALTMTPVRILYVNPRIEKWQEELREGLRERQKIGGAQIQFNDPQPRSHALTTISMLIKPILILTYAIIMLLFMLRREVSEAFYARPIRGPEDLDRGSEQEMDE